MDMAAISSPAVDASTPASLYPSSPLATLSPAGYRNAVADNNQQRRFSLPDQNRRTAKDHPTSQGTQCSYYSLAMLVLSFRNQFGCQNRCIAVLGDNEGSSSSSQTRSATDSQQSLFGAALATGDDSSSILPSTDRASHSNVVVVRGETAEAPLSSSSESSGSGTNRSNIAGQQQVIPPQQLGRVGRGATDPPEGTTRGIDRSSPSFRDTAALSSTSITLTPRQSSDRLSPSLLNRLAAGLPTTAPRDRLALLGETADRFLEYLFLLFIGLDVPAVPLAIAIAASDEAALMAVYDWRPEIRETVRRFTRNQMRKRAAGETTVLPRL